MTTAKSFLKDRGRPVRPLLAAVAALAVLNAALMVVQYRLLAAAIDGVVFAGRDLAAVWPWLGPVPLAVAGRAVAVWAAEAVAVTLGGRVKQTLRQDLFAHLLALGPVRLTGERTGDLATLLGDGVEAIEPYFTRFLPAISAMALIPLAILAAVLPADWISALILIATAPLIPVFMILIGSGAERLNRRQWARLARLNARFLEAVQNLTVLKLFNASRRESALIARGAEDYRVATMTVLRVAFLSALALEFFATLGIAVVAVFIGFRLLWGDMTFARGLFVLLVVPDFYLPLRSLGTHYHARMEAVAVAERLAALFAHVPDAPPPPAATVPSSASAAAGGVVFEGVRLVYPDGRVGLDGVDFRLEPGTLTALVGPSGAGKSSVVSLLAGFVAPTAGRVLIDGRAPAGGDGPPPMVWVPQRPTLFRGTIGDNVRLGRPDASAAAVAEALALVGADAVVARLPGGLDHAIAERGGGVSGGQARLIALARAALCPAPLLVLDEPTASLDRDSERRITAAVARLARTRTVLVVAHRLETVARADTILVLERGRVAESGPHAVLMAADGLYADLVRQGESCEGGLVAQPQPGGVSC